MENQIQKYSDFGDIAKSAPVLLTENQTRIGNAVAFGDSLLAKIQTNGMSKEIDQEINNYLVKLKNTLKDVKEKRTPITQILSTISKEFTTCEQLLDSKRSDTTWFKLQKARNDYARKLADEAKVKEAEKQLKIDQEQEIERLKLSINEFVIKKYNDLVFSTKEGLRVIFNDLTLDEWDDGVELINSYTEEITMELYRTWIMPYASIHISADQKKEAFNTVMLPMREKLNADLQVEIAEIKQGFTSEYPGKKNELIAIRDSKDKKEKERIQKEADNREAKRLSDLAAEKKIKDDNAQNETIAKTEEIEMLSTFKTEQVNADKPKRTGYEIKIKGSRGYLPIMNTWFENEGINLPSDAAERLTLGRMKKFCESYAHKFDEKIQSPYLEYEEVFNQKAK
ncbi:hypothetical protein KAR91_70525 [Candidatus Pacearchaeota archaeon]|nr:hypothetical protein [Candidatus Pacearchaeota archaeon]